VAVTVPVVVMALAVVRRPAVVTTRDVVMALGGATLGALDALASMQSVCVSERSRPSRR
jgi:hypothetical protein